MIGYVIGTVAIVVVLAVIGALAVVQRIASVLFIGLPFGALLFTWWRIGDRDVDQCSGQPS
ncbi:MAG: hypothetical protein HY567_01350 [Candidatus Kerfeldbacteria bacterium]|nr:hypothetical protein [Candidatus Kerfeldbacteria bacterium]